MGRIRTVKPELFKHEELFEAEQETGLPLRLAFIGLFTCCDREGRFKWRPRTLKTDVMPFDDVDFSRVLDALTTRGFVVRYRVNNEDFGLIPSFTKHQVINNRESPSELPEPLEINDIDACTTRDSRDDDVTRGEGKGREGKGNIFVDEPSTTGNVTPIKPSTPDCPHQAIVDLYHEILPTLTQVRVMTEARQKQLRARWRENPKHQNLDFWRGYFEHVSQSDFLMGRSQQANGRAWAADFDFLTTQSKFVNVIEGKYHHG